ncbi:MAG TPA: hypothetical protein VIV60_09835 [Polyangiaceae bacterium]|jgi:hypothetical protein
MTIYDQNGIAPCMPARHAVVLVTLAIGLLPAVVSAQVCPVTKAAIISTAGDSNGLGSGSQSFAVPPGYERVTGRVRFLSNEWPDWYGSKYNDTYLARLTAPGKLVVLASGNLNSSSWGPGLLGFNGAAPEVHYDVGLSGLTGKTVTLSYEVRDVGDLIYDSALAIDAVHVHRTRDFVPAGGGTLNADGTLAGSYGQTVRLTFRNVNVLGTTINVTASPTGESYGGILLPQQSVTYTFARWGSEPMSWSFDVSTQSDAFIVTYGLESTWVEGMPSNPCQ